MIITSDSTTKRVMVYGTTTVVKVSASVLGYGNRVRTELRKKGRQHLRHAPEPAFMSHKRELGATVKGPCGGRPQSGRHKSD